jgi:Fic family protein
MIRYELPRHWILYDQSQIFTELVEAKAAVQALTTMPYQRAWVEALQAIQLKREVAGTSRIEGADFTEHELDVALAPGTTPDALRTRSQRQAHSTVLTYRWIAELPDDRPIDEVLIKEVHRRIVTGCDDDHCQPGQIRGRDYNVTFGVPPHRGCEGGPVCEQAFKTLVQAVQTTYRDHDLLVQALALHYHFAAMHPFLDGNGRTARAIEALVLQRAKLTDNAFIAMSNYYYDEKNDYLESLSAVRAAGHDLTPFLKFGLKGIRLQCERLHSEIRKNMERALFRNTMFDLFKRLASPRKRVIGDRQIEILKILLEVDEMDWFKLRERAKVHYKVNNWLKMMVRDMNRLLSLGAIDIATTAERQYSFSINLRWPQQITESKFFEKIKQMPKSKTYKALP